MAITDSNANIVEQRQFGAWGVTDKFLNSAGDTEFNHQTSLLNRGYTGHEHFFGVALIHMNGRLYDAKLGRFLAPDNFVQSVFDTQSYNRYGYVLNNPLMYADPSGEFWHIVIGAVINMTVAIIQGKSFGQVLLAGVIGAVTAMVGVGIGNLAAGGAFFSNAAAGVVGFTAGAGVGAMAGMAGGFTAGMLNTFANGGNLADALGTGIKGAISGAFIGAAVGGVMGGIKARKMGVDFWEADRITNEVKFNNLFRNDANAVACNGCDNVPPSDGMGYDSMFHNGESISDFRADLSGSDAWSQNLKAYKKAVFGSSTGKYYKLGELYDFNSIPTSGNGWSSNAGYYHAKTFLSKSAYSVDLITPTHYQSKVRISTISRGIQGKGVPAIWMIDMKGQETMAIMHFFGNGGGISESIWTFFNLKP